MSIEQRLAELERRVRELEARENLAFNATNITGGTLSTDRYSAYADLNAEFKIGLITGQLASSDLLRSIAVWSSIVQDWTSTTLPSGWAWAGTPFVTPGFIEINYGTVLRTGFSGSNQRAFLYRSAFVPSVDLMMSVHMIAASESHCGLRIDDGTDNNYCETVVKCKSDRRYAVFVRWRIGGGAVSETEQTSHPDPFNDRFIGAQIYSPWSNWAMLPRTYGRNVIHLDTGTLPGNLTWTPSRIGFVVQSGANTWERFGVDWTNF